MKRYVLMGMLLFLVFAVSFAPAGLLSRALEGVADVDLVDTRGTVWQGQGQLLVNQTNQGQLTWDFQPTSLLSLEPAYDWRLARPDMALNGEASAGINQVTLAVQGAVTAQAVNTALAPYDIELAGDFNIQPTNATVEPDTQQIEDLDGQINWQGGRVRYTLSGVTNQADLPPLVAILQINDNNFPEAVVYEEGGEIPLLTASQRDEGFVKIGITKLFTKVLRTPWPGSDPDHAVVLEVEEQIF